MAQYGIPFGLQIKHNKKDRQYISFVESTENSQIQSGGMFYLNPVKMDSLILNTLEDKYLLLPTNFNNLTPNDCTVKEYKSKDGSYYKKTVDCRKSLNNENVKSFSSFNSSNRFQKNIDNDDLLKLYSDDEESDSDEDSFDLFDYIQTNDVESEKTKEESYNKSINKVMELLNTLENDIIL